MADKIALEDEKYAELESDLKKKHENILELLYGCNFSKSKSFM